MKWLLKFLTSFKDAFLIMGGYLFGYKQGASAVADKVERADFEARKKKRDNVYRLKDKWDRIRSKPGVVVKLPRPEDNGNS